MTGGLALAGRVALIAGANGPFGRAIAVALAEAGAEVALTTSTTAEAEQFAINSIGNELWAIDRRYLALVTDLADPASVDGALRQAAGGLGGLDVIVMAASQPSTLLDRLHDARSAPSALVILDAPGATPPPGATLVTVDSSASPASVAAGVLDAVRAATRAAGSPP